MKNLITLILVLICINAYSQFPAPKNFEYTYNYIQLNESDVCAGVLLNGPTYCSHFKWNTPDTATTKLKLESYKIYYQQTGSDDSTEIVTLTDTVYNKELAVLGTVWVTAIYSNPEGESEASNKVQNTNLPLQIDKKLTKTGNLFVYNSKQQTIILQNIENIEKLNVIDINGRLVMSEYNKSLIDISGLPAGIYIIEVKDKSSNLIRQKITK